MRGLFLILPAVTMLFLGGCAYKTTLRESAQFENTLLKGQCDFSLIDKKLKSGDDAILWNIQAGSLARDCKEYKKSISFFDEAETRYKFDVDLKNPLITTKDRTKSILINNNLNDYEGNVYEKVMVNTYKALNFLNLGDKDNARVEFNRALERQRIAKEYFSNEIRKQEERNEKNLKTINNKPQDFNFNSKAVDIAMGKYAPNSGALAYADFINPFALYMSALFLLNDRSYQRAADLMRESYEMNPNNPQIKKDFALAETMASAMNAKFDQGYVWLIYENGLGAVKDETRIDLPLFIVSDSLIYTGVALPILRERGSSYGALFIKNGSGDSAKSEIVADMDAVIRAEFNKRFSAIAAEAMVSAAVKTISQKQLHDIDPLLGILGAIFQRVTTDADVRSWSALPKRFEAASIPIKDGNIEIIDENGVTLLKEFLPSDKNAIIYLKSALKGQITVHKIYF
ncbi:MAG: hypothetical protein LBQ18_01045 [Campylobacteraceae bacterium]|jgi:hypothetical protein|nr:hypothetical protein [Campylobacteraceae bacterium]